MSLKNYVYKTPDYAKESMSEPQTLPEFAEEAAKIITWYVRKYSPKLEPTAIEELHIRDLLAGEKLHNSKIEPKTRDYMIKVFLFIIDRDEDYEQNVLGMNEPVLH